MSAIATITVELDAREIRSLHFAATLLTGALREACDEEIPLADGRLVHPGDSAVMKLETALIAAGEEF